MLSAAPLVLSFCGLLAGASGPGDDVRGEAPGRPVNVLVVPLQVRQGGSQFMGEGFTQFFTESLRQRAGFHVITVDDLKNVDAAVVKALSNCLETRCAVELGGRAGADEVITGVIDGASQPALLRMWRTSVADGVVVGMYSARLTEPMVNKLSEDPSRVINVLVTGDALELPPVRWQQVAVPEAPVASRRPLIDVTRVLAGVGLGAGTVGVWAAMVATAGGLLLLAYNAQHMRTEGRDVVPAPLSWGLAAGWVVALVTGAGMLGLTMASMVVLMVMSLTAR